MRIAISGHRDLYDTTATRISAALHDVLGQLGPEGEPVTGISCLADGADQMFARAVLDHGGTLEVVIPARSYRDGLPHESHVPYDNFLAQATTVRTLDHEESTSQAHMDASRAMLEDADHLVAVWDGKPARGYGGTADVVAFAQANGIPITVVWPEGAQRGQD